MTLFKSPTGEYWLGLKKLRNFTANAQYELLVKLEDQQGNTAEARYSTFSIGPKSDNYRLTISGYNGTAADSMKRHNNQRFTTKDIDNDEHDAINCAVAWKGGWWYQKCHHANLNGLYDGIGSEAIVWYQWKEKLEPLKSVSMMIKPKN